MAPLPKPTAATVTAIYRAYEQQADAGQRPRLGASVIGRECERALWYAFRWVRPEQHDGRVLRLFQRGQREEAIFVADLRAIGCTVHDVDPVTGEQFRFADLSGHLGGSMDGAVLGVPEAPQTWHCAEFKTHNAKSFNYLESKGVAVAKPEHQAQMQLYMAWSGMTRALYLAVCKDTDALYSERLHADPAQAQALIAKARRIITAAEPPARISERPDWYQCQWCSYRTLCHEGALPAVNCRTCAHATPELEGEGGRWSCARFACDLHLEVQRRGNECLQHVFIPALVPWPAVDADPEAGSITYQMPLGGLVVNGPGGVRSGELGREVVG